MVALANGYHAPVFRTAHNLRRSQWCGAVYIRPILKLAWVASFIYAIPQTGVALYNHILITVLKA